MEKIKIEREAIVLDKKEKEQLTQCLKYCAHRFTIHDKRFVDLKFINYLLLNL